MKIAVTGASGHVGVNLCKKLLEEKHEVIALAHKNADGLKRLGVKVVSGDTMNKSSLLPLVSDSEIVFHLAARISITGDKDGMVSETNGTGTRNVVETAMECGVRRFFHFSSIHAFEQHPLREPLDETRPLVGSGGFAYDRSKAAGERAVMAAVEKGLDAVILSPTAIMGPDDYQPSLAGNAVIELYNNKIPALVPGGYDWVDVRDIVKACVTAMDKAHCGEKYLLSGHWHSLPELSAMIGKHAGHKTPGLVLPFWLARVGLPFITLYSRISGVEPLYTSESLTIIGEGNRQIRNDKARAELGFDPRPLDETIRDLILWFRSKNYLK
jgi:dihydroflavonol-4-reductase